MKKPVYSVRHRGGLFVTNAGSYAVDEYYDEEVTATCTAGHPSRIAAEASASALQGAIERFIQRNYGPVMVRGQALAALEEAFKRGAAGKTMEEADLQGLLIHLITE